MPTDNSTWAWFRNNVLPGLFAVTFAGVGTALWATYNLTQQMAAKQDAQAARQDVLDKQAAALAAAVDALRAVAVTRPELDRSIEGVGQRIELALWRAGLRPGSVRIGNAP